MQKILLIILIVLLSVYFGGWLMGYEIGINSEWMKIYNVRDGYRSWTICYSDGYTWDSNGKLINLWRWPSFHHCYLRPSIFMLRKYDQALTAKEIDDLYYNYKKNLRTLSYRKIINIMKFYCWI